MDKDENSKIYGVHEEEFRTYFGGCRFPLFLVGIILKTMTTYPVVIEQLQAKDSAANKMLFIAAALIILRIVIPIFRRSVAKL